MHRNLKTNTNQSVTYLQKTWREALFAPCVLLVILAPANQLAVLEQVYDFSNVMPILLAVQDKSPVDDSKIELLTKPY